MEGKVVFALLYILIFPVLLFILAGDFFWIQGWVFTIWFVLLCYSTILYLYRKDPALLAERYKQPGEGNQEAWDRYVMYGIMVGFMLWIVIMPLDAKRFGCSPDFPLGLNMLGVALLSG
ncbi:MAG: isoprenylcysteine carboxyl methyltransferase, partial [Methanobacteriota archaeon]